MSELKLLFLGSFQAFLNKQPISKFESSRVRALLAYLAVEQDQPHSRVALAGLFWPESSDQTARKNLRQALSNLRKAIADQDANPSYLKITRENVQFQPASQHRLDAAEFGDLIDTVDKHSHRRIENCRHCATSLQRVVDLYRGDFLQGFFLDDSSAYQDWMLLKRERFHRQVVQALTVLTQYYEQRLEIDLARRCAYLQVEIDPWREAGYQHLMRILAIQGERSVALRQYAVCKEILDRELGVSPSPETEQLYQQVKNNLLESKPAGVPRKNLPPQTTSFIGRDGELRSLLSLLGDPSNRLVTLVGPGGVGKTRLALQATSEAGYDFLHGVCFIPLVSVISVEVLPSAIADALGFVFQGREPPADQLINYLRKKEILLVLDNIEHLLDDLDLVVRILQQAPDVTLMITSREPLNLLAEQLFDVTGLAYSETDNGSEAAEALVLFQDRAQRLKPTFFLDEGNLRHVAGICRLVDGLPLAIELAASLVRQWTCAEIEIGIQDSLNSLASSMRDLPARHRSLRATFQRSWDLLSSHEQNIFEKLAIFRGGFEADAARQIVAADVADLAALVEKSLLRRNVDGRYEFHPLIWQYLQEKLDRDSHQREAVLKKLYSHYAGFLQEAESKLKSSQQPEFLELISLDFENIQTAWQYMLSQKYFDQIDQSLEALYLFFEGRSRYRDGAALFDAALDVFDDNQERVYWRLCLRSGALSYRLGQYDRSQNLLEQGLQAFQKIGDTQEAAFASYGMGNLAYLRGNFEQAVQHYQISLDIARDMGAVYEASQALNGLGLAVYMQGNYARAQKVLMDSLTLHDEIGDPWGKAIRYNNLALVTHARGQYAEAKKLYTQSQDLWKFIKQDYGMASCFNNLGLVSEALGENIEARQLYADALTIFDQLGHRYGMASCLNNLGNVAAAMEEYEQARKYYQQAFRLREILGDQRGIASVSNNLGRVADILDEHTVAREHFVKALEVGWDSNVIPVVLDSLLGFAELSLHMGLPERGEQLLTLVVNHSASNQETVESASNLLLTLNKDNSKDVVEDLVLSGDEGNLDQIVNEILLEQ